MTGIEVNIEIYCGKCGKAICHLATPRTNTSECYSSGPTEPTFDIEPCPDCQQEARDEGFALAETENEKATELLKGAYEDQLEGMQETIDRYDSKHI